MVEFTLPPKPLRFGIVWVVTGLAFLIHLLGFFFGEWKTYSLLFWIAITGSLLFLALLLEDELFRTESNH